MARTPAEHVELAHAYLAASAANDAEALVALHEPDAVTWHNTDGVEVPVPVTVKQLRWLHRSAPGLAWEDVTFLGTDEGFVARWTMVGTTPGGAPFRIPSCLVVDVSDAGKVARVAEYLDSAALAVFS
jgi:ketosteroid isomerase-like protein